MKLSNRFPDSVKEFWIGHYYCFYPDCEKNHADCLHHILSPSSIRYIAGEHNQSLYNSCPLNNWDCHLHKPMHTKEMETYLLKRIYNHVEEVKKYQRVYLTDNDKKFLEVYKKYYND